MNKVKHLKKGDTVVALSGVYKGKTGKVAEVNQSKALVKVDGIGVTKRHTKPNQANPKGGIVEKLRWLPASKFQVSDASGKKLGRAGFVIEGKTKKRVFSSARAGK